MSKNTPRSKQSHNFQAEMAKKREKEFRHQQKWNSQVRYYDKWDKANTKFEDWTSPRYYESNNELIEKLRSERAKSDETERRRAQLKKLLAEDDATYAIELMIARSKKMGAQTSKVSDIPTELLKDVNHGLKISEDERRRHEAETKLYQHWRTNNPAVRDAERARNTKDLKLSWLDQQIEKRMRKEREEDEIRRSLDERERRIQEQKEQEENLAWVTESKNKLLQEDLLKQMEELRLKQELSEELRRQEAEECAKQTALAGLEESRKLDEARRKRQEIDLANVKQHKLRVRQKARDVQENLGREMELARQILRSEVADRIRDGERRREVKETVEQFLAFAKEQAALEKRRQDYLDFIFDSEARLVYDKQHDIWLQEQGARRNLIDDVLRTIKEQIGDNIAKNVERQKEVLAEREQMLQDMENYEREMEENNRLEVEKRNEIRRDIDEQLREKRASERQLKGLEKTQVEVELEKIKREEEKLKREIMNIQKTHGPPRYARKKAWR